MLDNRGYTPVLRTEGIAPVMCIPTEQAAVNRLRELPYHSQCSRREKAKKDGQANLFTFNEKRFRKQIGAKPTTTDWEGRLEYLNLTVFPHSVEKYPLKNRESSVYYPEVIKLYNGREQNRLHAVSFPVAG